MSSMQKNSFDFCAAYKAYSKARKNTSSYFFVLLPIFIAFMLMLVSVAFINISSQKTKKKTEFIFNELQKQEHIECEIKVSEASRAISALENESENISVFENDMKNLTHLDENIIELIKKSAGSDIITEEILFIRNTSSVTIKAIAQSPERIAEFIKAMDKSGYFTETSYNGYTRSGDSCIFNAEFTF